MPKQPKKDQYFPNGRGKTGRRKGFNDKQRRFIAEYLIDQNGTQAAIRAGYSRKSAPFYCQGLLKKAHIRQAIDQALKQKSKKLDITTEKVLLEMARVAFGSLGAFMKFLKGGEAIVDFSNATEDDIRALVEVQQDVYVEGRGEDAERVKRTKIKMHDKMRALEMLGKHLNLFDGQGSDDDDVGKKAAALRKALKEMLEVDGA